MRLKRALCRLHARQPWMPKPASDADAAARVAPAWAWLLGPSAGCGKRGCGAGRRRGFKDLGIAQRWARVRCVVRSWAPRRVAAPSYVASGPRATAGSVSSDRCPTGPPRERARTRPRKKRRKFSHGTRIGSFFGIGATSSSVGSDVRD